MREDAMGEPTVESIQERCRERKKRRTPALPCVFFNSPGAVEASCEQRGDGMQASLAQRWMLVVARDVVG
jgi:hypothetical protein